MPSDSLRSLNNINPLEDFYLLFVQVQTLVTDDNCFQVLDCYSNFIEGLSPAHLRAESRVAMEMGYQGKVEALLNGENCFKIIFVSRIFACLICR